MITSQKTIRYFSKTALAFGIVELASLLKMSYMVGSWNAFFTGTNIAVPMTGIFGGAALTGLLTLMRALARWMVLGSNPASFLVFHVPGVVAAFYWRSSSRLVKIGLPLLCMALFIAHAPDAWLYSLYWLIPVGLYVAKRESIFEKALAATFVAHGVGSVIWAYTIPMTAALWYALIPVVAIERLVFASGMAVVYHAATILESVWDKFKQRIICLIKN